MPADIEMAAVATRSLIQFEATLNDVLERQSDRVQGLILATTAIGAMCLFVLAVALSVMHRRESAIERFDTITDELRSDVAASIEQIDELRLQVEGLRQLVEDGDI